MELPRIIRPVIVSIRSRADRNSMHTRIMRSCTRCFFSRRGPFHLRDISELLFKQQFPFFNLADFVGSSDLGYQGCSFQERFVTGSVNLDCRGIL